MKAMVLAAGLGTRLMPLTRDRPKALVTVAGRTLLEITLERLRQFGVTHTVINVHHFAGKVVDYLQAKQNFGMHIDISWEEKLLDTGGALQHAARFLRGSAPDLLQNEPFFLHNVDVISTIDLERMRQHHLQSGALATLAVQQRDTSRYLLFDGQGRLCGARREGKTEMVRPAEATQALAFSGIHVISPMIFSQFTEQGAFSIVDAYLRLARDGDNIARFRADEYRWRDVGRPAGVQAAEKEFAARVFG